MSSILAAWSFSILTGIHATSSFSHQCRSKQYISRSDVKNAGIRQYFRIYNINVQLYPYWGTPKCFHNDVYPNVWIFGYTKTYVYWGTLIVWILRYTQIYRIYAYWCASKCMHGVQKLIRWTIHNIKTMSQKTKLYLKQTKHGSRSLEIR